MGPAKKPKSVINDYGRRPSMEGGPEDYASTVKGGGSAGSYRELLSQTTDFVGLKREQQKHSEFKKPYLFDDYPEMEFFYQAPQFDPLGDISLTNPSVTECWDVCRKNHTGTYTDDDCYVYIWLHVELDLISSNIEVVFDHEGPIDGFGEWRKIYKSVDTIPTSFELIWQVAQPLFEACPGVDEVHAKSCKKTNINSVGCCGGITPMEWDTLSDETIERPPGTDTASVSVVYGQGPYKWSVSGTGFTLDESETEGLSNILNADATACGSAVITVEDSCGSVTGGVRCITSGSWVQIEDYYTTGDACGGMSPYPDTELACYVSGDGKRYFGAEKIVQQYRVREWIYTVKNAISGGCTYCTIPYTRDCAWDSSYYSPCIITTCTDVNAIFTPCAGCNLGCCTVTVSDCGINVPGAHGFAVDANPRFLDEWQC